VNVTGCVSACLWDSEYKRTHSISVRVCVRACMRACVWCEEILGIHPDSKTRKTNKKNSSH